MKYDDQAAAWAAMHMLEGTPPYEIGRALGGNATSVRSLLMRFCGTSDRWELSNLRGLHARKLLKPALAAYCEKAGILPGDKLSPGRPLVPPREPKPAKPKPIQPPDMSEYGVAKTEYLAALARLKAAKARRDV